MPERLGAVFTASGFGRRFGSSKLLAEVNGIPLYHRAMMASVPTEFDRAVACSPYPQILAAGKRFGFLPLYNGGAAEGVSVSIRSGLARMSDLDRALFAVCDQPWLTTKSIICLKKSLLESPDTIYTLSWQGQRDNPAIFPTDLFGELATPTGDTGDGAVIHRHPGRLRLVGAFSPNELLDVDNPETPFQKQTDIPPTNELVGYPF